MKNSSVSGNSLLDEKYIPSKVRVKLSMHLYHAMKHHIMKTYGGVELYLHACLTLALDGGE
jgi:hypothetical protein